VLDGLRAGDELEVLPPAGGFGPRPDPARARRYGLLAAGSGITPVLSIAWTVLEVEPESTVVLVYGNRTSGDVMFLEELSDLKDRFPERLQVLHVLSREEQESELLSGRLDPDRLRRLFATLVPLDGVDEWYLCGPFGMVTDGRQTLLDAGVDPRRGAHRALPRRPAAARGSGEPTAWPAARRSPSCCTAVPPRCRSSATARRCSTPSSPSAATPPTPARAGSAARAARAASAARSRWT
jgi:ring-1,2-phenylacetyl-CoA epoxidase subunit PaaE